MATDPVCGMYVDPRTSTLSLVRENRTYYFCAESCRESFAQPEAHRARLARQLAVAWPLAAVVALLTYTAPFPEWPIVALGLAAIVQGYAGRTFYRGTWDALRSRIGNMDLLVAVATTAAFGYSAAVVVLPGRLPPSLYFDASSLILALILTGNYLEQRTRSRASAVLRALRDLLPATATRMEDGRESLVALDLVSAGDVLRVRPHARFPADGTVRTGASWAEEAVVTGESAPVPKSPSDRVVGGTRNGDGVLDVVVTAVGPSSFLGEVGRLVTDAEANRMPLRRLADRIASGFAPAVLVFAVGAAVAWAAFGHAPLPVALLVFVTVAITACPCAFGIATPAAISLGAGRAAEMGILFRGEETIGRLAEVDCLLVDKTGTITLGRPTVRRVVAAPGVAEATVVGLASAVSVGSDHPLGRATVEYARGRGIPLAPAEALRFESGLGAFGVVGGGTVEFGRRVAGPPADPWAVALLTEADAGGETVSFVRYSGTFLGAIAFVDPVAPGVPTAIAALAREGIRVELVTGDRPGAARAAAATAGISLVHSEQTPGAKRDLVAARQREGRVVGFVGDGINDAGALLAADVGIAIGTGTEVAREAGGVLLVRGEFAGVPAAVGLARATVRKVRQNLTWAVGYNLVLLPIAAGALVPWFGFGVYAVLPVVGALAMALSSTSVVVNSLTLRTVRLAGPSPSLMLGSTT
ncbi:MAG: heavy metal translocating P-type ATPase [Thermoplasmata archaeon]|nr:heavy metal translocating P-type ATPase [Thermoplasmata archaeon]